MLVPIIRRQDLNWARLVSSRPGHKFVLVQTFAHHRKFRARELLDQQASFENEFPDQRCFLKTPGKVVLYLFNNPLPDELGRSQERLICCNTDPSGAMIWTTNGICPTA